MTLLQLLLLLLPVVGSAARAHSRPAALASRPCSLGAVSLLLGRRHHTASWQHAWECFDLLLPAGGNTATAAWTHEQCAEGHQ